MKRYSGSGSFGRRKLAWSIVGVGILLFLTTFTVFPKPWNDANAWLKDRIGFHLPYFPDTEYTLGLDLQGGVHLVYEADMEAIDSSERADALGGVRDVIERRVNAFGVGEPVVQTTVIGGNYRVLIDLPGVTDVAKAVANIGETPVLEFKTPDAEVTGEATAEEQATIDANQKTEKASADDVLRRARAGEDFSSLAKENSIDTSTKDNGGYAGFVSKDDATFGKLVENIIKNRTRPGVISGVYESNSNLYVVDYRGAETEAVPKISHILICYSGAPSCTETRTKEDAQALAQSLRDQATTENFAQLARDNSDDTTKDAGGDLGYVERGTMVKPFEDAAYALENGEISDVVESQYGFHILYRTGSKNETLYELAAIRMEWTTLADIRQANPWKNTELSGKHIKHATVAFDQNTNQPFISLEFNSEGADLFGKLTAANVGKVIGIFLDGEPITTPTVQEAIYGGRASITGNYTLTEAKLLAQRLNAGALPVPISVVSQQTIGPALGQSSLDLSIRAGLLGFLLIVLFIIGYYRVPGIVATLALVMYAIFNLAAYKWFGVTMTLSGIAGLVLSLGIAVDANVLVFERLKEELWTGRDIATAVDEAFKRAWPSIRDGNLTTLIATAVLYSVSTGFIRGFALTLTIGVLLSIFSSMFVTRLLMHLVLKAKFLNRPFCYRGLKKPKTDVA